jgi:hypothetical protein
LPSIFELSRANTGRDDFDVVRTEKAAQQVASAP